MHMFYFRQGFVPAAYVKKIDPGLTASQQQLLDNRLVSSIFYWKFVLMIYSILVLLVQDKVKLRKHLSLF